MDIWAIGVLVWAAAFVMYVVRRRGGSAPSERTVEVDDEVDAILSAAGAYFQLEDDTLTAAHFMRVALCAPVVAHLFEHRGHPVAHVASALSMQRGGFTVRTEEGTGSIALDDELTAALQRAYNLARERDQVEVSAPLVVEALVTEPTGPTGRYLAELDLVFEDHGFAVAHDDRDDTFVYVWNDDRMPMNVVTQLLQEEAGLDPIAAWFRTTHTHHAGYTIIGPYADDEAAEQVRVSLEEHARDLGWPLRARRHPPDVSGWRSRDRGLLP